jgi:hypothetical protein
VCDGVREKGIHQSIRTTLKMIAFFSQFSSLFYRLESRSERKKEEVFMAWQSLSRDSISIVQFLFKNFSLSLSSSNRASIFMDYNEIKSSVIYCCPFILALSI